MATAAERTSISTWGLPPTVRKALARFVLDARGALEDDFRRQLASLGVHPDRVDDLQAGRGFAADEERARQAAIAVLDRSLAAGASREEAFETFVRDSAFTFLNRLVGLRCLEERGMLLVAGHRETAIRADKRLRASSLYFRVRNELPATASRRDVWRETLHRAFRAVSERVGLLFDPESEYGCLLPLQPTLTRIIDGLNDPGIPPATWGDDEVLGWVYQYYNSEEKNGVYQKLGRGGKIERPEELAAASCLYTERYMVDFLLQNTLGALWVEMNPETTLPEGWPHYVRSPDRERRDERQLPQRVRDITLLDPAVGSGHFHARAFDLLVQMYEEEGLEDQAEIPHLILEKNLHGIDIDLRAVQITALRLYLKACEIAGPDFRPRRLNLVSADIALPGTPPAELLERFRDDRDVQNLLEEVWCELRDAPKLGSLLHPERRVRELLARRRAKGPTLEHQDDEAWEQFEIELLEGIRDEVERQAESEDLGQRLFGRDLAKGMSLVEALARRYDVVVTNPPYAGSKNLDPPVKAFVEREYKDGKRDLYAAFILRCIEFARPGGSVGMVTQQSWLFLRSFAKLRGRVLNGTAVTTLAHLGPGAFEEIGGEVVNVSLFTLRTHGPAPGHRMTAFRLVGPKSPVEKDSLLRQAIAGDAEAIVSTPKQADLQAIPETPFVYWLRPRFFELLRSGRTVSSQYPVKWGVSSSDNDRFLRLFWEVVPAPHWLNHAKGGGFSRWRGLERWVLDWSNDGELVKEWILERYPYLGDNYEIKIRDHTFFKWGWSYSSMARHGLGFRLLDPSWTTNAKAPAILSETRDIPLGALLNGRVSTYLVRALMTSVNVDEGYVAGLPLPDSIPKILDTLGEACLLAKSRLVARDLTERGFNPDDCMEGSGETGTSTSLLEVVRRNQVEEQVVAGLLHSFEAYNERLVFDAYELDQDDVRAVLDETGIPSGWYPLIPGYDRLPELPAGIKLPDGFAAYFASLERRELSPEELNRLKGRLRKVYEAGPRATTREEESKADGEAKEDVLGAHIPIPAETFLEELSQKLQIHPVSVYNLLEELRAEGVYSPPEIKRLMEDWVSVALLLMLGYRWPEQDRYEAESGPALDEDLIDADGIIPLVPCDGQPTADVRLRTLLERRFGEERAAQSLDEFKTWVGRDLARWLERDFFARHSKQFKYRPIAWHLTSPEGTFQAFVLYHRLSRDTLRRLRDVYAGALIIRLRAELDRAEERKNTQQAQELRFQIEDVEEFRDQLTAIEEGRELRHRIRCRWKGEEQDGRPGPYAPDIDDGVKVNIRPFQETGLLARKVIKKW